MSDVTTSKSCSQWRRKGAWGWPPSWFMQIESSNLPQQENRHSHLMFRPGTRWRILHLSVRSLRPFQPGMGSQSPHPHHHLHKKKAVRPDVWLRIERRKWLDQLGSCGIINSWSNRAGSGWKERRSIRVAFWFGEANVCLFFGLLPQQKVMLRLLIVHVKSCIVRTCTTCANLT